jgi:hypothetical protein
MSKRWNAIVVVAGLVIVIGGAIVAPWYIRPGEASRSGEVEAVKARIEIVKIYTGIITAGVVVGGLVFTGLAFALNRATFESTRKSQLIERFSRAADQLGEASTTKRLGGIYTLEQIARAAPEYHWPVVELLSAHIRERAPFPAAGGAPRPDNEIQAILAILGRRARNPAQEQHQRINLRATDLHGLDLRNARLHGEPIRLGSGVDLRGANLRGAGLQGARFQGADFGEADLRGAAILGTDFSDADLGTARISEAQYANARTNANTIKPLRWYEDGPEPPSP